VPSPALVGTLALSLVVGGSVYAVTRDEPVTVARVVDGDTLDVLRDGRQVRIRLLNVDTPESVDPDSPVECLGPEATAYLQSLLPVGTQVRLEHDRELLDPYDRELAGVFSGETLVNAEIARAGYGVPVLVEPNDRFYAAVTDGWAEAVDQASGLMDPGIGCTPAHEVSAYEQSAQQAAAGVPAEGAGLAALQDHAALLAAHVATGEALLSSLGDPAGVLRAGRAGVGELRARVTAVDRQVRSALDDAEQRVSAEKSRLAAEEEAARQAAEEEAQEEAARQAAEDAAQEEAARQAAEEQAARQAAEEEAARRAAEEEAARRAAEEEAARQARSDDAGTDRPQGAGGTPDPAAPSAQRGGTPAPVRSQDPGSGPRPGEGYTGCRAYIGGPYIDDQGRSYTPIDCTTRLPLVP
jgi:micrococcal nuclease